MIKLTKREIEVLRVMATFQTNEEMGQMLSPKAIEGTMRTAVCNLKSKLRTKDYMGTVLKGVEMGIVEFQHLAPPLQQIVLLLCPNKEHMGSSRETTRVA